MKELKDYTIGEAMLICESADDMCWIHKKNADYSNADCMERCLFYDANLKNIDGCRMRQLEVPAYWNVKIKPLGEYTINELITRCYSREGQCEGCFLKPLCEVMDKEKPGNWNI